MITNKLKDAERTCKEREIRFFFKAPPSYEEPEAVTTTSSGDRRRMVSMKLPELPMS
ncbi:hypothetical protein KIN20_013203 [Parelaphostrongylus tenuis]|uniref:Uncharacterized protein n=1 Tax=Parelaphostrongylus tenuis TaxID=148309 RepID=A0AAD5MF79_PARTN|nr:hypothetical protein KIN20_012035 [Parelaphostrongylus tenuis]KAJ1355703.1 hypothetical protein KIN20_013203 [Parelaphostrongylus tenuis]